MSVTFAQTYLVRATCHPDTGTLRVPYRSEHLARVRELLVAGTAVLAGAANDLSASVLVLRAADADAARALVEADVYWRHGIWTAIEVQPFLAAAVESSPGTDTLTTDSEAGA